MQPDLKALLPRDKRDTERAEAIVALGFPAVEPVLPQLVEWMQDLNWPVAQTLEPFLASIGAPLAPHLRRVLASNDEMWKYWVISSLIAESAELIQIFTPELEKLVLSPTVTERSEELDVLARTVLERVRKFE